MIRSKLTAVWQNRIKSHNSIIVKWISHVASFRSSGKWLLLSAVIGIVAGLGGIAFSLTDQAIRRLTLEEYAGYVPAEAAGEHRLFEKPSSVFSPRPLLAVLFIGGLLSGALVYALAPEASGHGTDAAIEAFHQNRGYIRPITPLVKLVASALTIGTGGSGGREGPIAQIGAGFGSFLGTLLNVPVRDRRILLAVGMGAGIGAIFRAPLAGALFSAEILYREADLEADVIVPSAVASTISYSVFSYWLPEGVRFVPLFGSQLRFHLASLAELLPLTLLAVILVAMAVLYIKVFYGVHRVFEKAPVARWLRPAVGATFAGLIGLAMYWWWGEDSQALAVLGTGYGTLQTALEDPQSVGAGLLICIALFKILTTACTIGSGGSGGVFGPSMVIGGCTGAATGATLQEYLPHLIPQPGIFAIVGMAGFFSGAAHAPISTIVMVTELTGDYGLLVPTMWVSILCFILCSRWSLYEKQVPSRLDSPAHRGDFLIDVLEGIQVQDVNWRQRSTIPHGMLLGDILRMIATSHQHYFPVVDDNNEFVGIFSTDDVRSHLFDDVVWQLANARDVMTTRIVSVTPEDDLNTALKRFTDLNLDELPVVARDEKTKLLGMLRRKDVISRYNQRLAEARSDTFVR